MDLERKWPDRPTPTQSVARRVVELRMQHGWTSAQALADRCQAAGLHDLTRGVISKIESGRRASVTVEELVGLALVLDVAPADLLAPSPSVTDEEGRRGPCQGWQVTPERAIDDLDKVREWLRRQQALPGQDLRFFDAQHVETKIEKSTRAAMTLMDAMGTHGMLGDYLNYIAETGKTEPPGGSVLNLQRTGEAGDGEGQ